MCNSRTRLVHLLLKTQLRTARSSLPDIYTTTNHYFKRRILELPHDVRLIIISSFKRSTSVSRGLSLARANPDEWSAGRLRQRLGKIVPEVPFHYLFDLRFFCGNVIFPSARKSAITVSGLLLISHRRLGRRRGVSMGTGLNWVKVVRCRPAWHALHDVTSICTRNDRIINRNIA